MRWMAARVLNRARGRPGAPAGRPASNPQHSPRHVGYTAEVTVRVWHRRRRRWPLLLAALLVCLVAGAGAGRATNRDMPSVRGLESYRPVTVTQIFAADGSLVTLLGPDKRILLKYSDIPDVFLKALIATEDSRYYKHFGVDVFGVMRAATANLLARDWGAEGASTITMQLARSLFLTQDKTLKRKVQEALLALEIERTYSKEEILTFYCNQIYMGPRRYGVEAASRYYFGKPSREMLLEDAALLAGVIQNPAALSPFTHADRALARRHHVLQRMAEEGMITREQAEEASRRRMRLAPHNREERSGSYFVEEVRRALLARYDQAALYKEGLQVRTTLDPELQQITMEALRSGLLALQQRRGWKGAFQNVGGGGKALSRYEHPSWTTPPAADSLATALVMELDSTRAVLRVGSERIVLEGRDIEGWSGRRSPATVFRLGDLVPIRVFSRDGQGKITGSVEPAPEVEGAVVAIEPATGEIRALVGGFDYSLSEFDRAMQARRQPGSSFKPFVVSAALEAGWTPASRLRDEPTVFLAPGAPEPYKPENYYREYGGLVTLRETLEESRNIATVRLLAQVGAPAVIERARAMGIGSALLPYPSLALGAFEVTPLEMTSAFATLANQGIWVEPHLIRSIENAEGKVQEQAHPATREAMSPASAYILTHLLEGVISSGTAQKASALGIPLAGKTGTTNDYTDAWFIGFSPSLAVGVWVGRDRKESLGEDETGARAALPIWMEIMSKALAPRPHEEFSRPAGVAIVPVDRRTGLRSTLESQCAGEDIILEAFAEGTDVLQDCSPAEHYRLTLPYFLQRFPVNQEKELDPDLQELAGLLRRDPGTLRLSKDGRALEVTYAGRSQSLPLALDGHQRKQLQRLVSARGEPEEPSSWFGVDGRPAEVVTLQ